MFANQQALDRPSLEKYAQEVGLDLAKFKGALDAGHRKSQINADKALAAAARRDGNADLLPQRSQDSRARSTSPSSRRSSTKRLRNANAVLKTGTPAGQLYAKIIEKGKATAGGADGQKPQQPRARRRCPPTRSRSTSSRSGIRRRRARRTPRSQS